MKPARAALVCIASALPFLSACAPIVLGGAALTGMVASDRRTSGSQLEDQGIEMRASARLREQLPERNHINTNSYNRRLLLTGEVPTEAQRQQAERIAQGVENVAQVYNELAVMPNSGISNRSSDTLVTTRVKSALVDAKDLYANSVVVTTERSVVYLMGRVTQRESARIVDIAATTKGVFKVVNLMEIISEEEKARTLPQPPAPAKTAFTPDPNAVSKPMPPAVPYNAPVQRDTQAPAPVEIRPVAPAY